MKKSALIISLVVCFFSVHAQKIKYESSFEKAKKKALAENKPLAILISITPPVPTPSFYDGLKNQAVVDKFNNNFINYKVDKEDVEASGSIIKAYKVYRFPGFVFL